MEFVSPQNFLIKKISDSPIVPFQWIHKSKKPPLFSRIPHTVRASGVYISLEEVKRGSEEDVEQNVAVISAGASLTGNYSPGSGRQPTLAGCFFQTHMLRNAFTPVCTPLPTTPQESTAYYTTLQSEKNKIKIPGEFLGGRM